ncbi:cation:proton antiporter [Secundilactobacillus mixtipabuli]|uniref:Na+/H+ antiporter n=1 Tax=Secundilactobacillus mixtipabuli TaxID=1435342 RepID=A0A1Z5IDY0_9LACO|nr:sodium:proton antiporter [Secundilactobacillus mixtipabuli]GAW99867.1 Na+/H+ antiporter [Secundilactobacillus mixtipabuli]
MASFFTILLLVVAAIAANIVFAIYPKVPLAFYEIIAGVLLSLVPLFNNFHLEPEVFMLVIIAPLMFNDGQNTDMHRLRKNINSTLSLAVVLALVTILAGGVLTHVLWGTLPLALCFALAAIVTPTDAVAVTSITSGIEVPEHVMGALENESLFNDASGIVAMDLALTAFSTGEFSLAKGTEHFLVVFLGGIAVGAILGLIIVIIRVLFQRKTLDTIAVILPFSLLTPFIVYLTAEHFGFSGILAVVAAGIIHGIQGKQLRLTSTQTQVVTKTTWETATNLLNGFVFVLLGASIPSVLNDLSTTEIHNLPLLILTAACLYLLMAVMRFLWCMLNLISLPSKETRFKDSIIMALSGVHGTITLSMAFSLPLVVAGHAFPFRSAIILIAGIIILLSMIVPTFTLPFLLPNKRVPYSADEFSDQLVKMVNFAIDQLRRSNDHSGALPGVIEVLNSQKNQSQKNANSKLVHQLLQQTENVEQATVTEMIDNGEVEAPFGWQYSRAIIFQSQFAFLSPWAKFKMWFKMFGFRFFPKISRKHFNKSFQQTRQVKMKWLKDHGQAEKFNDYQKFYLEHKDDRLPQTEKEKTDQPKQLALPVTKAKLLPAVQVTEQLQLPGSLQPRGHRPSRRPRGQQRGMSPEAKKAFSRLSQAGYDRVNGYLDAIETDDNRQEVDVIRHYYNVRRSRMTHSEATSEAENELFLMAFQFEYSYVQNISQDKDLSSELIDELHKKISMDQMVYMQSGN